MLYTYTPILGCVVFLFRSVECGGGGGGFCWLVSLLLLLLLLLPPPTSTNRGTYMHLVLVGRYWYDTKLVLFDFPGGFFFSSFFCLLTLFYVAFSIFLLFFRVFFFFFVMYVLPRWSMYMFFSFSGLEFIIYMHTSSCIYYSTFFAWYIQCIYSYTCIYIHARAFICVVI